MPWWDAVLNPYFKILIIDPTRGVIPGKRSADPESIEGRRTLRWIPDRRR
jgi:hypothetical protein